MMKKIAVLGLLLGSGFLVAGGTLLPKASGMTEMPAKPCKENRVYIDNHTALMWQDQAYTEAENAAYKRERSAGKAGSYRHAVAYCSRLNYAGYSDWRLPTADELSAVHNKEGQVFTYFRDGDFWSSTPSKESKYYVVFPTDAIRYARSPRQSNYIRCVRCIANDR